MTRNATLKLRLKLKIGLQNRIFAISISCCYCYPWGLLNLVQTECIGKSQPVEGVLSLVKFILYNQNHYNSCLKAPYIVRKRSYNNTEKE